MRMNIKYHCGIVGPTGTGKTTLANAMYENTIGPKMVFCRKDPEMYSGTQISRHTQYESLSGFKNDLKNGVKFIPEASESFSHSQINEEALSDVKIIWNLLTKANENVVLYVDEFHNYSSPSKSLYDKFADEGRNYGIHLVPISQTLAGISKYVAKNTEMWVFFDVSDFSRKYFKDYRLPYDEIEKRLRGKNYAYIIYVRGQGVSGPFRLSSSLV